MTTFELLCQLVFDTSEDPEYEISKKLKESLHSGIDGFIKHGDTYEVIKEALSKTSDGIRMLLAVMDKAIPDFNYLTRMRNAINSTIERL